METPIIELLESAKEPLQAWTLQPLQDVEGTALPSDLPATVFTVLLPASLSEVYGGEGVAVLNDKTYLAKKKLHQEFLSICTKLPPCWLVLQSLADVAFLDDQNPAVRREAYRLLYDVLKNYRGRLIDRKFAAAADQEDRDRINTLRDVHHTSKLFQLLCKLLVSSVTDLWSPVRKIRELISQVLAVCANTRERGSGAESASETEANGGCKPADWRVLEGALLALAMVIKRFRRTSSTAVKRHAPSSSTELPHFESLRIIPLPQSEEEDPQPSPRDDEVTGSLRHARAQMQLRFCGKLYRSLPRFLLRPLRFFVEDMDLLGHPQLTVRENAIRLIATVVLRSPQHYAGRLFRYTLARLAGSDAWQGISPKVRSRTSSTASVEEAAEGWRSQRRRSEEDASVLFGPAAPLPLPLPKQLEAIEEGPVHPGNEEEEEGGSTRDRLPSFDGSEHHRASSTTDIPPLPLPQNPFPADGILPKHLIPQTALLPAFLSEGLLGLGVFLAATCSNGAMKRLWPWARVVLTSYLGHQASTVRQACSKVFLQVSSREDDEDDDDDENDHDEEYRPRRFHRMSRASNDIDDDDVANTVDDIENYVIESYPPAERLTAEVISHEWPRTLNGDRQTWVISAATDGSSVSLAAHQDGLGGVDETEKGHRFTVYGVNDSVNNTRTHGFQLMVSIVSGLCGLWFQGSEAQEPSEAALHSSMVKLLDAFTLGRKETALRRDAHSSTITWEYKEGILLTYELLINMVVEQYRKGLKPFAEIHSTAEWTGTPSLYDLGAASPTEETGETSAANEAEAVTEGEGEEKSASEGFTSSLSAFSSPVKRSPSSGSSPSFHTPGKGKPPSLATPSTSLASPDAKPSPFPTGSPTPPQTPALNRKIHVTPGLPLPKLPPLAVPSPNGASDRDVTVEEVQSGAQCDSICVAMLIHDMLFQRNSSLRIYQELVRQAGITATPPFSWHMSPDLTLLESMQLKRVLEAGKDLFLREMKGRGNGAAAVDSGAIGFGRCLWMMLVHVVECLGSSTFELRRMADQLLPLYTEFLVWFDPTIFDHLWRLSADAVHRRDSRVALLTSRTLADVLSRYRVLSTTLQHLAPHLADVHRFRPPDFLQFIPVPGAALPAPLVAQNAHILRRLLVNHTRAAEIITAGAPADGVLLLGCETLAELGKYFLRQLAPVGSRPLIGSKYQLPPSVESGDLAQHFCVRGALAVLLDRVWRLSSLAYGTPLYTVLVRCVGKRSGSSLMLSAAAGLLSKSGAGHGGGRSHPLRFLGFQRMLEWLLNRGMASSTARPEPSSPLRPGSKASGSGSRGGGSLGIIPSSPWWLGLLKMLEELHAYVRLSQKMYPHVDVISSSASGGAGGGSGSATDTTEPAPILRSDSEASAHLSLREMEATPSTASHSVHHHSRLLDTEGQTPSPPMDEPSPHSPIPTSPHFSSHWRWRSPQASPRKPEPGPASPPGKPSTPGKGGMEEEWSDAAAGKFQDVTPSRRRRAAVLDRALAKSLTPAFPAILMNASFGEAYLLYTTSLSWATTYEGDIRWLSLRAACVSLSRMATLSALPVHPLADAIAAESSAVKDSAPPSLPWLDVAELGHILELSSLDAFQLLHQCKTDSDTACLRAVFAIFGTCMLASQNVESWKDALQRIASTYREDAPSTSSNLTSVAPAPPVIDTGTRSKRLPSASFQSPPPSVPARARAETDGAMRLQQPSLTASVSETLPSIPPAAPPNGAANDGEEVGDVGGKLYTPNPYSWRGPALKDSISRLSVVAGAVCGHEESSGEERPREPQSEGREGRLGSLSSVDSDQQAKAPAKVLPPPLKVPSINTALANAQRGARGYIANMSPVGTPVLQTPSGLQRGTSGATTSSGSPFSSSADSPQRGPPRIPTKPSIAPVAESHEEEPRPSLVRSQSMVPGKPHGSSQDPEHPPFISHLHLHTHHRLSDASLSFVGRRPGSEPTERVDTPPMSPPRPRRITRSHLGSTEPSSDSDETSGEEAEEVEVVPDLLSPGRAQPEDGGSKVLKRSFTFTTHQPPSNPSSPLLRGSSGPTEGGSAPPLSPSGAAIASRDEVEEGKEGDSIESGTAEEEDEEDGLSEWDDWDEEDEDEEEEEDATNSSVALASAFLASLRRSKDPAVASLFQQALLSLSPNHILVIQWLLARSNVPSL